MTQTDAAHDNATDVPVKTRKKLIEVALPLRSHQQGVGAGEIDPAWPSEHAASLVGAAAAGGGAGGDLSQMVDDPSEYVDELLVGSSDDGRRERS